MLRLFCSLRRFSTALHFHFTTTNILHYLSKWPFMHPPGEEEFTHISKLEKDPGDFLWKCNVYPPTPKSKCSMLLEERGREKTRWLGEEPSVSAHTPYEAPWFAFTGPAAERRGVLVVFNSCHLPRVQDQADGDHLGKTTHSQNSTEYQVFLLKNKAHISACWKSSAAKRHEKEKQQRPAFSASWAGNLSCTGGI